MFSQIISSLKTRFSEHKNYFDASQKEVSRINLIVLRISSVITTLMILLLITITPLFFPDWAPSAFYWIFFAVVFLFALASQIISRNKVNNTEINILCLAFCSVILFFSTIIDTVINPQATANFFPILLVVLPVVFIFKYVHIIIINVLFEMIFVILVSNNEAASVVRQNDIFNSLVSFIISLTVALIVLSLRVDDNSAKLKYKKLSKIDYLTSIYNKNTCESSIFNYFANRAENCICALIIMDIDNFKSVNDEYGHSMGDRILEDFSRCLLEVFGDKNILGRIGGDEFMVLCSDISEESVIPIKCRNLQNKLRKINYIDNCIIQCSIGAAIVRKEKCSYFQMFELADNALYEAKNSGKNRFVLRFFSTDREFDDIKPSIVLIDYDDIERVNIHNALCKHYEIKEASNDSDAENVIESLKDRLSGAILDFHSNRISSLAIAKYIRNNFDTDIPIIAIVPKNYNEDLIFKMGICDVITRPVDETVLNKKLQNVIINNIRK